MLKNILSKFTYMTISRYIFILLPLILFVIVLPLSMILDSHFPRLNFPYIFSFCVFAAMPIYLVIKLYISSRRRVIGDTEKMNPNNRLKGKEILAYNSESLVKILMFLLVSFLVIYLKYYHH